MNRYWQALLLALIVMSFLVSEIKAQVVINEFVVDGSPEWVELKNASDTADYLKKYYVDDDENFSSDVGSSGKKSLANLNISNIAYPVFDLPSSIFNNTSSDWVVLFDPDGNVVDSYSYEKNPGENISIGRSPDGTGDFYILSSLTKGIVNSQLVVTPSPTSNPTASPTSAPTQTPAPTPTKSPTPVPTKVPTAAPTKTPQLILGERTSSVSSDVAGLRNELATPKPASSGGEKSRFPFVAVGLVAIGAAFIGTAGFLAFKKSKVDLPNPE